MIPGINRFGKGADVGFVIGALAILPFALYAGYGLAGYYFGPREGIIENLMFVLASIFIAASIMTLSGLIGAVIGLVIEWIIKRAL